ncbi:MAG: hypothetical protein PF436_05800 [Prolixibacteraceae bacterium]|jgi:hypothetical protein|nr:hypothetical protein [Prolixibacteraceae bacterium]
MNVEEKLEKIEDLTSDFSLSRYNFLKISALIKLIEDTHNNIGDCDECRKNENHLENLIEQIPNLDDNTYRTPYEKEFNKIRTHFHKSHGYIPPYYFSARYSLMGIIVLLLLTMAIKLIFKLQSPDLLLAGATAGLAAGYLYGSYKEKIYRKQKKIV